MAEDSELLSRFASEHSESAFGELVTRYLPLVYSTALRQTTGDSHLAQDIAQLVFADLARKAHALSKNIFLAGWLHRATIFAARQILRGEDRRRLREQQAVTMNAIQSESESADWQQIRPLLDDALERLNKTDRDALLLRFFEEQSLTQIGQRLGGTEDAARKRITRALEKLRMILQRHGVTTTAAALSTVIPSNAVQIAPAGLATSLANSSLAAAKTGTTFTLLKMMTATKLKFGILTLVVAGAVATFVVLHQTQAQIPPSSQTHTESPASEYCIINLQNVPFPEVLITYTNMCNARNIKVDAPESVVEIPNKTVTIPSTNCTPSQAIHLLEQAFHDQVGIEVLHPSTNQVVLRLKQ